jgi:hypothetical protein
MARLPQHEATTLGTLMPIEDLRNSLPRDLSADDVLIDCDTVPLEMADLPVLIDELIVRRRSRTLTLLRPPEHIARAALGIATSLGVSDRLRLDPPIEFG